MFRWSLLNRLDTYAVCKCRNTMWILSLLLTGIASHVSPRRRRIAAASLAVAVANVDYNVIVIAVDLRAMMPMRLWSFIVFRQTKRYDEWDLKNYNGFNGKGSKFNATNIWIWFFSFLFSFSNILWFVPFNFVGNTWNKYFSIDTSRVFEKAINLFVCLFVVMFCFVVK